jgi:hypothetical protein
MVGLQGNHHWGAAKARLSAEPQVKASLQDTCMMWLTRMPAINCTLNTMLYAYRRSCTLLFWVKSSGLGLQA